MSRGWNSGALFADEVSAKLSALIERSKAPVLSDVRIHVQGVDGLCLVPRTIADVFAGAPLTIAGSFKEGSVESVQITAVASGGHLFQCSLQPHCGSKVVPLRRVFVKALMDQLTAEHWLTGDPQLAQEIVDLSVAESIPSPMTSMLAYELAADEKHSDRKPVAEASKGLSAKQVAAFGGGALIVGTGLVVAGSVANTLANAAGFSAGIGAAVDGLSNAMDSCPCNACCAALSCGNLDCDHCADCVSCGLCHDCADLPCVPLCADVFDALASVCGDGLSVCANAGEGVVGVCGNCCDACDFSDIFDSVFGVFGLCFDLVSDIFR